MFYCRLSYWYLPFQWQIPCLFTLGSCLRNIFKGLPLHFSLSQYHFRSAGAAQLGAGKVKLRYSRIIA